MGQEERVTKTYQLGGITSNNAAEDVRHTLTLLDDVTNVSVDLDQKQVTFDYNPNSVDEQFIKTTLNNLGFSYQGEK